MKRIAFIAASRRHLNNSDAAARDFFAVSPLFRYGFTYCDQTYEETFILSRGSLHLIHPDSNVSNVDAQLEYINKMDKKNWVRSISNEIREFVPIGTTLYFHTSNWYDLLFKWLEPDYTIEKPMRAMAIGKQLHFYKSHVGALPSVINEEAK